MDVFAGVFWERSRQFIAEGLPDFWGGQDVDGGEGAESGDFSREDWDGVCTADYLVVSCGRFYLDALGVHFVNERLSGIWNVVKRVGVDVRGIQELDSIC